MRPAPRLFALGAGMILLASACAPQAATSFPNINLTVDGQGAAAQPSLAVQILLFLTLMTFIPALVITVTSFTRIIIVFSLLRSALAVPQVPPNQVLMGLALFLTMFVMAPTFDTVNRTALQPYLAGSIAQDEALRGTEQAFRTFMFKQVNEKDLALFISLGHIERPRIQADVPTFVLVPAFLISELKIAFEMGFIIFIPFLIIDIVVSSVLMSMGMLMLPPVLISLPFKLLLFILVDGWHLITRSLVLSFNP